MAVSGFLLAPWHCQSGLEPSFQILMVLSGRQVEFPPLPSLDSEFLFYPLVLKCYEYELLAFLSIQNGNDLSNFS